MEESSTNRNMPRMIASKIFVCLARENNKQVQELVPLLHEMASRLEQNPVDQEAIARWGEIHNRLVEHACVAIISASTAVEAYIYDYGARGISPTFMEKYVDKLGLLSKWVVVPQLVKGRPFPCEGQGIELLRKLVNARNSLVHFHSGIDKSELNPKVLAEKSKEAIRTLDALREDMERFDRTNYPTSKFHNWSWSRDELLNLPATRRKVGLEQLNSGNFFGLCRNMIRANRPPTAFALPSLTRFRARLSVNFKSLNKFRRTAGKLTHAEAHSQFSSFGIQP